VKNLREWKIRNEKKGVYVFTVALVIIVSIIFIQSALAQVQDFTDITSSAAGTSEDNPYQVHTATQLPAEVDKPVQWVKQVDVHNLYDHDESELTVSLPCNAQNVMAVDMSDQAELDVEVRDCEAIMLVSLDFNEQGSYLIKYETPSPEKHESNMVQQGDAMVKSVVVSSDDHYEDVFTHTEIPEMTLTEAQENIRLYWMIDGYNTDVTDEPELDVQFHDSDGDGLYDQMSWIAPHLSTQIFEVVIFSDADPGSYPAIGIDLLYPADGEYIMSNSRIGFNYSVHYNASTTVFCNMTIDGAVRRANIPAVSDLEINDFFNLSSGDHSWYVSCAGDDGSANTSGTRTFTLDLEGPVVTLNTPDYHVSHANSIDLNFTPVDNRYPVLVCGLSVNGALNRTNIITTNGTLQTVTLTGLPNGVYDWNVSCEDAANNLGSSEERVFYISQGTPSEFNISPNKNEYSMGETGYLIINARAGSNLTLFIDKPNRDSFFKYFNGRTFPLVEMINYTDNGGTYRIDGIFTEGGKVFVVKTSFEVTNTFNTYIDVNETAGIPGAVFNFETNATGGIGNVTYEWDFDDGTTGSGPEIDHKFGSVGEYTVEVTATDGRGNRATDTIKIDIYNKHMLHILVRELQTQKYLANVSVEVDDQRKYTDSNGKADFETYEGKRRIYVTHPGYEWVKQVRNITEETTITIDLNNTGMTEYTSHSGGTDGNGTSAASQDAKDEAEKLLAQVSAALDSMESGDQAAKALNEALGVETGLQNARKRLRQIIRDLGNAELDNNLTAEQKQDKIDNIRSELDDFGDTILSFVVQDTTEFVDYPKTSDIAMLSAEYIRFKGADLSKGETQDYIDANTELQSEIAITTRLSIADIELLSGDKKTISVVINKLTKLPVETDDKVIIEYIPKEAAESASQIVELTGFEVVKADPILKFAPDIQSYSYYIDKKVSIDKLKNTKHVILHDLDGEGREGLSGVTGFSVFPSIHIDNPKLALEIALIIALLIAYLAYHFELVDRYKDWRSKNGKDYGTDMAYKPESSFDSAISRIKGFVRREDAILAEELSSIRSLVASAFTHADNMDHKRAEESYRHIMKEYKSLSKEAKSRIHHDTKQVFNKVMLAKIHNLTDEAFTHIGNGQHSKAQSNYSEIKKLYKQLEKEHRAAVSVRCIKLHEKLFENSLA
jgi:hypothetical protein